MLSIPSYLEFWQSQRDRLQEGLTRAESVRLTRDFASRCQVSMSEPELVHGAPEQAQTGKIGQVTQGSGSPATSRSGKVSRTTFKRAQKGARKARSVYFTRGCPSR